MTEHEYKLARLILIGFFAVIVMGFIFGLLTRPSGIHQPPPAPPTTSQAPEVVPEAEPVTAGHTAAAAYVERSTACRNPGGTNQAGYCWYEGWAFTRKTVCIDSSISGNPLAGVAKMYTGIGGLRLVVGGKAGACAAKGYPASQRVSFLSMSKNTAARWSYRACGLTQAANYGNLNSITISVYVTGTQRTPCGAGAEWQDVFAHEMGHALGLSHRQPYASSIMRDGHGPDASDRAKLSQIYINRKA